MNHVEVYINYVRLDFGYRINDVWLDIDVDVLIFLNCHNRIFTRLFVSEVVAFTCLIKKRIKRA